MEHHDLKNMEWSYWDYHGDWYLDHGRDRNSRWSGAQENRCAVYGYGLVGTVCNAFLHSLNAYENSITLDTQDLNYYQNIDVKSDQSIECAPTSTATWCS